MSYDMEEEINEVDGESDSNSEVEELSYQNNEQPIESIEVEDDIFDKLKKENTASNFPLKVNTIIGHTESRKRIMK